MTVPVSGSLNESVTSAGDYILTGVTDDVTTCVGTATGTQEIVLLEEVTGSIVSECRDNSAFYQIRLTLDASSIPLVTDENSISVTGTSSTVTWTSQGSGVYLSSDIPESDVTEVTVGNNNGCAGLVVGSLQSICTCPSSATFTLATGEICSDGTTSMDVAITSTSALSGPWTVTVLNGSGPQSVGALGALSASYTESDLNTSGIYTITVQDEGENCSSSTSVATPGGIDELVLTPSGSVSLSSNSPVCEGEEINLTATVSNVSSSSPVYTWSYLGIEQGTTSTPVFSTDLVGATGSWTVSVANNSSCASSVPVVEATGNVEVNLAPIPEIDIRDRRLCLSDAPLTLTASNNQTQLPNSVLSYRWYGPSGEISGATSAQLGVSQTGIYEVVITSSQGNCSSERGAPLGTSDITVQDLRVVINNGSVDVERGDLPGLETYRNATTTIYNRWGQVVFSKTGEYYRDFDGTRNGKDLPMGTYYYTIQLNVSSRDNLQGDVTIIR